jgi:chromate transporter
MSENPFLALIIVFAPLSLLAIGGASAIYAPLQHQAVDVHQWVSGREYLELFAIARVTPGPGSMLATLVGWRVAGFPGALIATLSLYIPARSCVSVSRTPGTATAAPAGIQRSRMGSARSPRA